MLLFTLLLGSYLRLANLATVPISMNQDELVNGYDAYSLSYTLRDHHGNFLPLMLESFGDWVSPVITYLTIPFVRILGLNTLSVRLPVALLGIGSIYLIYTYIKQIFKSEKIALLGAFLLALSPWSITLSRWAIPPNIVPFFMLLTLCLFNYAYKTKKKLYIVLFILSAILLTFSYPTEKVFAPLLVIILLAVYYFKDLRKAGIISTIYLLAISPIYIITFLDPIKYNSRFNAMSILHFSSGIIIVLKMFIKRFVEYFTPYFLFGSGDNHSLHHVPGVSANLVVLELFFYLGIILSILIVLNKIKNFKLNSKHLLSLLLLITVAPVAASITIDEEDTLRVIQLLPFIIIFACLSLYYFDNLIKDKSFKIYLYLIFIFLAIIGTQSYWNIYTSTYKKLAEYPGQYGVKEAIMYSLKNQYSYDSIIIDSEINMPYIYYLFYSSYDPRKLNYNEINRWYTSGQFFHPTDINNYHFGEVTQDTISKSTLLYIIKDSYDRIWYKIYSNQKILYIKYAYTGEKNL